MAASLCYVGVLNINWRGIGWSEKYFLDVIPGSLGAMVNYLPVLNQIAWGRTAFFGQECQIVNARVSSTDPRHDGLRCQLPYPVGPHPSWSNNPSAPVGDALAAINDPETVLQMRFETANGGFWQRYIHCPPDPWVIGKGLSDPSLFPYVTCTGVAPPADLSPVGGLSHLQVCQGWWNLLRTKTQGGQRAGGGTFNLLATAYITYAQVTDKKVGRAFGIPRGRRQKTLIS